MKTTYKSIIILCFLILTNSVFCQVEDSIATDSTSVSERIIDSINSDSEEQDSNDINESNEHPEIDTQSNPNESEDSDNNSNELREPTILSEMLNDVSSTEIDIEYDVELVPQQTGVSCWAASAAMIVGWRDGISIDPQEIARGLGDWREYFYNGGLPPDNIEMFHYWGLTYVYPQTYTVQGFVDLIENGPLWVATDLQDGAHIVVVSAIRGDGTPDGTILTIMDPWERGMTRFRPSNQGSIYQETYREFVERQERLAIRELHIPNAFYIAY